MPTYHNPTNRTILTKKHLFAPGETYAIKAYIFHPDLLEVDELPAPIPVILAEGTFTDVTINVTNFYGVEKLIISAQTTSSAFLTIGGSSATVFVDPNHPYVSQPFLWELAAKIKVTGTADILIERID